MPFAKGQYALICYHISAELSLKWFKKVWTVFKHYKLEVGWICWVILLMNYLTLRLRELSESFKKKAWTFWKFYSWLPRNYQTFFQDSRVHSNASTPYFTKQYLLDFHFSLVRCWEISKYQIPQKRVEFNLKMYVPVV